MVVDLFSLIKANKNDLGNQEKAVEEEGLETTIVVVGTAGSGKSSILNSFLEKDETPNPTTGLEYSYGRKTRGQGLNVKDVAHCWELGGNGVEMRELMSVPINENNVHCSLVILNFDLSKPKKSAELINAFLTTMVPQVNQMLESLEQRGSKRPKAMRANANRRYAANHPDKTSVQPFVIPLLVVGTKYDTFKSITLDRQRFLTRALRWFAHIFGASLFFTSHKDAVANGKLKSYISTQVFKTASPPAKIENITDYTKPVVVMAGTDSIQDIFNAASDTERAFQLWRQWMGEIDRLFAAVGGEEDAVMSETIAGPLDSDDNNTNLHLEAYEEANREPMIDGLIGQKSREIDLMREEFNQRIRAQKETSKRQQQKS